jgi:4-amino-4-deoxychorismate lyase
MILVNGRQTKALAVSDRGLQYGDGVFETIAIIKKQPQFLGSHLDRLVLGCKALSIKLPDLDLLKTEIASLAATLVDSKAVLKIIITRGPSGRGYRPDTSSTPTRILSLHPWGAHIDGCRTQGIDIKLCKTRLACHPRLAGIKHLNRLEQVLASAELTDDFQEGIMLDANGLVIEGTMSNLFIVRHDKHILTPQLSQCGIQGIMKNKLINYLHDRHYKVTETDMGLQELFDAKNVIMSNSIIGLWPVRTLQHEQQTRHYALADFADDFNKSIC